MLDDYVRHLTEKAPSIRFVDEREGEILQLIAEGHSNKVARDRPDGRLPAGHGAQIATLLQE